MHRMNPPGYEDDPDEDLVDLEDEDEQVAELDYDPAYDDHEPATCGPLWSPQPRD